MTTSAGLDSRIFSGTMNLGALMSRSMYQWPLRFCKQHLPIFRTQNKHTKKEIQKKSNLFTPTHCPHHRGSVTSQLWPLNTDTHPLPSSLRVCDQSAVTTEHSHPPTALITEGLWPVSCDQWKVTPTHCPHHWGSVTSQLWPMNTDTHPLPSSLRGCDQSAVTTKHWHPPTALITDGLWRDSCDHWTLTPTHCPHHWGSVTSQLWPVNTDTHQLPSWLRSLQAVINTDTHLSLQQLVQCVPQFLLCLLPQLLKLPRWHCNNTDPSWVFSFFIHWKFRCTKYAQITRVDRSAICTWVLVIMMFFAQFYHDMNDIINKLLFWLVRYLFLMLHRLEQSPFINRTHVFRITFKISPLQAILLTMGVLRSVMGYVLQHGETAHKRVHSYHYNRHYWPALAAL